MATYDAHANLSISAIAIAPVPAASGTSLTVAAGDGAFFPTAPFQCTIFSATPPSPLRSNAEIVRVTAVVGDVLTIVRAQEGTTARAIIVGDLISNTITVKTFTDIENSIIQGISAVGGSAGAGTVLFDNSPTVTFGRAGQTITASVATNAGGITNINLGAGTTSQNLSAFTFSNSNGLSFGLDAALSQITGSYTVPSTAGLISRINVSAGSTSSNLSAITFSNANNISFGLNGGTITASAPAQSIQPVAASASNGSFVFSTLSFSNANNVTFGTSAGGIITASVAAAAGAQTGISGLQVSNATYTSGTVTFQNANGISFGSSGANGISASYTVPTVTNSSWTVSDAGTSGTVARLAFTNLNGVTLSLSTGAGGSHTIVGSHNALTSQSNQNIAAANGGFAFQTLSFSNANNVSFSTSAGSAIVASVTVASTQGSLVFGAVGSTNTGSQLIFSNSNNVTFGLNGSTLTASVTVASTQDSFRISAGTTNTLISNLSFADSNGISFGLNGSTITASANPGVGKTLSFFEPVPVIGFGTFFNSPSNGVLNVDAIMPQEAFSFTNAQQLASYAMTGVSSAVGTSGNMGWSVTNGIYSRSVTDSAATNFSLSNTWASMWSGSAYTNATWSASVSSITVSYIWQTDSTGGTLSLSQSTNSSNLSATQISGQKLFNFPYGTSCPVNGYLFAQMFTTSSAGGGGASNAFRLSIQSYSNMTNVSIAPGFGLASNTSSPIVPGMGILNTAAWPATLATSQLSYKSHRQLVRFIM